MNILPTEIWIIIFGFAPLEARRVCSEWKGLVDIYHPQDREKVNRIANFKRLPDSIPGLLEEFNQISVKLGEKIKKTDKSAGTFTVSFDQISRSIGFNVYLSFIHSFDFTENRSTVVFFPDSGLKDFYYKYQKDFDRIIKKSAYINKKLKFHLTKELQKNNPRYLRPIDTFFLCNH